ncbi:MAG: NAD-dependent epimerase/dehydratase family protein [Bacteroides sp.]|nr:NAD-dependent epimerase/dehydratase family protein [Bacteroides sp.]
MNILITGATGFIGKHLIKHLSPKHTLSILIRRNSDCSSLPPVSSVFTFQDNIEELADFLQRNQIDGIIHLASLYVAEHKSEQIKEMILSNIYLGTALLEACKKAQTKWFLNTGTIWQNYNASDYSDMYNPVNLYAASKQAFLTMAKYYTETTSLRFCTLKLCDTYGPNDTRRKIFSLFEEIARTGETLAMSPGEQKLDIIHIDDAVTGFESVIERLNDDSISLHPEYVLSSGKQIPLRELAAMYEEKHHVKLNIAWGGRPYRQREVMVPYKGKIPENWKPKIEY